jgi:hypothetical protein
MDVVEVSQEEAIHKRKAISRWDRIKAQRKRRVRVAVANDENRVE